MTTPSSRFEREALSQLPELRRFASRLCRDADGSDDLVQETLLRAFRAFASFAEGTNCRAWLFRICRNAHINTRRRTRHEVGVPDAEGLDEWMRARCVADTPVPEDLGDDVARALGALPEEYRTALLLCDLEEMTYQEIAGFTNAPVGTVRSRIHRGRKIMAGRLAGRTTRRGIPPAPEIEADFPMHRMEAAR
jgi:RNA polymerase sigma-70 factor (ECF subfamily)